MPSGPTTGIRKASRLLLGALVLITVFAATYELPRHVRVTVGWARRPPVATEGYIPRPVFQPGTQYIMVFAGSATCGACAHDSLPDAIERLKLRMAALAEARGATFKAVGVSTGWSVDRGVEFLSRFGRFDEISAGGSWSNSILSEFMWRNGFVPAVPVVALYERIIEEPDESTRNELRATAPRLVTFRARRGARPGSVALSCSESVHAAAA